MADHPQTQNDLETQISALKQQLASLQSMREILGEEVFIAASTPLQARIEQLVQTGGGAYIAGDVHTDSGDVTGRDKYEVSAGGDIKAPVVAGQGNITFINTFSNPKDMRTRYLEAFSRSCQSLPLAVMGADEGPDLDVTLDQIYIDLETTSTDSEIEEETSEEANSKSTKKYLTALEITEKNRRLVLLGDPGSGKSTFVRKLAGWLADAELKRIEPPQGFSPTVIPVILDLRDLAPFLEMPSGFEHFSGENQEAHLLEAFYAALQADLRSWGVEAFFQELYEVMQTGNFLLVLDGLDEVAYGLREQVRQEVRAIARYFKPAWLVITCRVRSYSGNDELPGFNAYTLRSFDGEKIQRFASAWYYAQFRLGRFSQQQAGEKSKDLIKAALSKDLREMASNPMLLTTMAIIHQREITLPSERVKLYKLAVEVLLQRWQRYKLGDQVLSQSLAALMKNERKLLEVMERLAYEAHSQARTNRDFSRRLGGVGDLPRMKVIAILGTPEYLNSMDLAHELLDYIDQRAGLLIGRGGEPNRPAVYSFPHLTFQEYLAGCYLVGQRDPKRTFYNLAAEGDAWDLVAQLGFEELYINRRVENNLFDLAYGFCPIRLPDTEQRQRAVLWAGQITALMGTETFERDIDNLEDGTLFLQRLRGNLVAALGGYLTLSERLDVGNALVWLGDPRFDPHLFSLPKGDMLGFIEIPEGLFPMGSVYTSDSPVENNESPLHNVYLSTFYLACYPVTVAQFRAFVKQSGYQPTDPGCISGISNHPVVRVTWHDAEAYCAWLDRILRERNDIPEEIQALLNNGYHVRLPTEAEWEKAARGQDGRIYPWGNEFDTNKANTREINIRSTSPVGCFANGVSPYGIIDMSGNVFEWCADWYGGKYYSTSPNQNPSGPKAGSTKVLRGGSWRYPSFNARCPYRRGSAPNKRSSGRGFRCALTR